MICRCRPTCRGWARRSSIPKATASTSRSDGTKRWRPTRSSSISTTGTNGPPASIIPRKGKTFPFMRRESTYFFVDQYNSEFNRCVQPMKDGYTDNYYMQMAQNIRRYKGVRPIPELTGLHAMKIDGDFADWDERQGRIPRHGRRHVPPRLPGLRRTALQERFGPQRHRHQQGRRGR